MQWTSLSQQVKVNKTYTQELPMAYSDTDYNVQMQLIEAYYGYVPFLKVRTNTNFTWGPSNYDSSKGSAQGMIAFCVGY